MVVDEQLMLDKFLLVGYKSKMHDDTVQHYEPDHFYNVFDECPQPKLGSLLYMRDRE